MVLKNSSSPSIAIIISDMSIKNNVATSITHIYTSDKPLMKTIYYAVHVTSTEVELFTIRCGINQSLSVNNIFKIVVITDSIYEVKKIFDLSVHPYQTQLVAILLDLYKFLNCCEINSIEFWECPSHLKWHLHNKVGKETKMFNLTVKMIENGLKFFLFFHLFLFLFLFFFIFSIFRTLRLELEVISHNIDHET